MDYYENYHYKNAKEQKRKYSLAYISRKIS